jgi:HD-like signal output (HDOD) protein
MKSDRKLETQVVELVHRLPPMPQHVDSLLRSAVQNSRTEEKLIELAGQDPGLCAELLHMANTCGSTPGRQIDTIAEAVESVGSATVVQLVGVWYVNGIIQDQFSSLQHLAEYFQHSQDISLGCSILSDVSGLEQYGREALAVAGLIHDIGRLVMLLAADRTTAHLIGTPWDKMTSMVRDERELLGMDHCLVGQQICRKWSFAPYVQEGVLRHHSPLIEDDLSYLGGIIFLTHFVTCSDFTGEMLSRVLPIDLCDRLGLARDDIQKAREQYLSRRATTN